MDMVELSPELPTGIWVETKETAKVKKTKDQADRKKQTTQLGNKHKKATTSAITTSPPSKGRGTVAVCACVCVCVCVQPQSVHKKHGEKTGPGKQNGRHVIIILDTQET